ncbi:isoaspartyl peptidase/L-asparaginase [Porticoccaceae bacterium]|nr:isoaspartyl peptidase/L-asparaginase [Porticoccaceae bacterium]MDB2399938.1 isoaspartyl peptidase/L-asparaginase [Porticoccaceae bacterium]
MLALSSLYLSVSATESQQSPIAIVIHGGAGTIQRELMSYEMERRYREVLANAIESGYQILKNDGSSTEAVIATISILEDSPLFNAGHGAVFNHDGNIELDASIMQGGDLNAGAVAAVSRVKNPITLALAVLEHSPHVMLVGEGAEMFAQQQGIGLVSNQYFKTERRRLQLEEILAKEKGVSLSKTPPNALLAAYRFDEKKLGTVGAVAIDKNGDIAAGTSTGGMTNKRFGRVGDVPVIGAGTYADNNSCGISATGHGEYFIRAAVAHDVCARMEYKGVSLQQAQDEVVQGKLVKMNGSGGVIGVDKDANIAFSFNSLGMYRASINKDGVRQIKIFKDD